MYAMVPLKERFGRFTLFFYSSPIPAPTLIETISRAEVTADKGRGGIRIFEAGGARLVSRKYVHGGLFRAFTRDLFLSRGRATREADIMAYLQEKSFPTVVPYCAIVERLFLVKRLHLVTYLEEGAVELLDQLRQSSRRERLRWVRRLALIMWLMKEAGVFHPDFHLRNVLVVPGGRLVFLDFDRARKRSVSDRDMRTMFLRLERFADKMVRQGRLDGDEEEKLFFLRTYGRLSGVDFIDAMREGARRASFSNRLGWFVESLLYRRPSPPGGGR